MTFDPVWADDYPNLKKQACSLLAMYNCRVKICQQLEETVKELRQELEVRSPKEVNALRIVNELLTIELERLRNDQPK